MPTYQRKDKYYHQAKSRGLPSRAGIKIEEMIRRFGLVKPGDTVIDLGAAPGGWTLILAKTVGTKGKVLALDLEVLPKFPPANVQFFQGDIQGPETDAWLKQELAGKKCRSVVSDMSPKLSGIGFRDYYQSYELGVKAWEVARRYLMPGGNFVVKQFPGKEFEGFLKTLRGAFKQVKVFEPVATRKTSKEVYLIGLNFVG